VDQITIVFGIIMTSAGVLVSFVFPALIYVRIEKSWFKRIPAIIFIFISGALGKILIFILSKGLICFVLEIISTIERIINLFK
jgi:uncharacterized membrane protein